MTRKEEAENELWRRYEAQHNLVHRALDPVVRAGIRASAGNQSRGYEWLERRKLGVLNRLSGKEEKTRKK